MMRPIVLVLLVSGGSIFSLTCTVHARTNVGREFVFAYAENYRPNSDPSVIITNMSPLEHENVTVKITSPVHGLLRTVILQGFASSEQVTLPREVVPTGPDFDMVAIIVEADDDVAVHAINDAHDRSMDGFAVLPISALGTEYFVASYTPSLRSQIVIVATESDTSIKIDLSNTVIYKDREVKGGKIILIAAQNHDAFLLNGRTDLTGTKILTNKPVAVMTGNRCAFIPVGVISCDHLVEMLPPFSQWGRKFVVMPFLGRSTGIIYRVIAGRDNTEVTVNSEKIRLQHKEFREYEVSVGQTDFVQSSQPVQVVQYTKGFKADDVIGDPAMTIVPPVEQSINSVKLPTYNMTKDFKTMENYVNIYAPCKEMYYFNLTLDGRVIRDIVSAQDRIVRVDRSDYCAVGLHLAHGIHALSPGPQGGETFIAIAYGFAEMNSYAWPAGLGTRDITCEYVGPDGGRRDYDCNKEIVIEGIPCNDTGVSDGVPCENVDCVPNEYVIYISAGVAVSAIILQQLFSYFIMKTTKPRPQLAFGQLGQRIEPPDIAIHSAESNPDMTEATKDTLLPPPTPQMKSSRQERADRMRRHSRSPSPAPSGSRPQFVGAE